MAKFYHEGDGLRLQCTFTISGTKTDPTAISLKVQGPTASSPTEYTYALSQITKGTTGVYYKDITFNVEGTWHYKWTGTGAVAAVDEGDVYIKRGPL